MKDFYTTTCRIYMFYTYSEKILNESILQENYQTNLNGTTED